MSIRARDACGLGLSPRLRGDLAATFDSQVIVVHTIRKHVSTVYGAGEYTYELVGGWAKCPQGWSFLDVCGLSIDSQDMVYVLSRSAHPVMVFDREGNL
ncbi:MAG: hypothetical protein IMY83_03530, partial [Chloroflexi bacterium]|nr:hypothetical protein [Chloroflexota bacterium]